MAEDLTLEDILARVQAPAPEQQIQQPTQERGFASLLGSALGGGSADRVGTADDETAGRRALLNFGLQMLDASGPSPTRRSFGQILARGLSGAGESQAASEAVSAAKIGAAQEQRQKAQEMRIAALKEAIPLLTLQQKQKAIAGMPGSLTGTSIGAVGAGGADPVASMSKEEARAAIAQRESGNQNIFSNIKVEGYRQDQLGSGYYQIIPSTWREGAKLAGVDTSQYPLAINAPKEVQDKVFDALWDKYGAKPWAQSAPKAPAGAPTTTTAAATPPDAKTPPAGSTAAPATTSTPGRILPPGTPVPPEPPSGMLPSPVTPAAAPGNVAGRPAGGAVVAGPPGAATVGAARPAGPAVEGDVNAIIRGMVSRGADPGTLAAGASPGGPASLAAGPAAGQASPKDAAIARAQATNTPQAVPGVDGLWAMPNGLVTGQRPPGLPGGPAPEAAPQPPPQQPPAQQPVTPPAQQPAAPARAPLYVRPPLTEDDRQAQDPNLSPETKQSFEREFQIAKSTGDPAAVAKVQGDYARAVAARAQQAQAERAKYNIEQQRLEQTARIKEQDVIREEAKAAADRQAAADLETQRGNQAKDLEYTKSRLGVGKGVLDDMAKTSVANRGKVDDLNLLQILSDSVADDSLAKRLSTMKWGDTTVANKLASWGMGTEDFRSEVGKVQQLQTLINNTVVELRKGVSMGNLSDKDLNFIEGLTTNLWENKETRGAVIKYMKELYVRQSGFNRQVALNWDDGRGMTIQEAIAKAQEKEDKHPILPMPDKAKWTDRSDPANRKWREEWVAEHKIVPGSLMRDPVTQDMIVYGRDPKAPPLAVPQPPAVLQQPRGPQPATN